MSMISARRLRGLLHQAHGTSAEPDGDSYYSEGAYHEEEDAGSTLDLRIAGVFVILAAGLIGCLPPLFLKVFRKPGAAIPRLLRALSAGIILGLATIHIIPDAQADLGAIADLVSPYPYDFAGLTVVFGVIIMVVLQSVAHNVVKLGVKLQPQQPVTLHSSKSGAQPIAEAMEQPSHEHNHSHDSSAHAPHSHDDHSHSHDHASSVSPQPSGLDLPASTAILLPVPMPVLSNDDPNDPHAHNCMRTSHYSMSVVAAGGGSGSVREQVMAVMFELGCIFHSVIIGIGLGVMTGNRTAARALVIALSFHQWLEGIALGGFITTAGFGLLKGLLMTFAYSLTCPVGIAIGIAISSTYDEASVKALAIQGTFNGVSGGMLLYIALVMLIAEDFTRRDESSQPPLPFNHGPLAQLSKAGDSKQSSAGGAAHSHDHGHGHGHSHGQGHEHEQGDRSRWVSVGCHTALAVGAGVMAILAIWA